jgi:hypothetical protein
MLYSTLFTTKRAYKSVAGPISERRSKAKAKEDKRKRLEKELSEL